MIDVAHSGPALLASFLASSVECVEALTIVLAVGAVRGWRPALIGAGLAAALLAILVAVLGAGLGLIPLATLQTAIGVLLLLFGMRWLRKSILRAGGLIPLRDEAANYASETRVLRLAPGSRRGWDPIGVATSFNAVTVEGIEVVFIVIAVGAVGGAMVPATVGALAAAVVVAAVWPAAASPIGAGAGKCAQIRGRNHAVELWHLLDRRRLRRRLAGGRSVRARFDRRVPRRGPAERRDRSPHST